jgi:hypothetical protein
MVVDVPNYTIRDLPRREDKMIGELESLHPVGVVARIGLTMDNELSLKSRWADTRPSSVLVCEHEASAAKRPKRLSG